MLSKVMEERNLSIRQVERLTGISKSAICDIKNGKEMPTVLTIETIAKGLKVRITDLIESDFL